MFNFEWDETKAAGNLKKHGVSFDEAVTERRNGIRIISARRATRYEKGIYQTG